MQHQLLSEVCWCLQSSQITPEIARPYKPGSPPIHLGMNSHWEGFNSFLATGMWLKIWLLAKGSEQHTSQLAESNLPVPLLLCDLQHP